MQFEASSAKPSATERIIGLDDPAQFVDDGYQVLQQLTSLHREFAQRLFEVVDPRDLDVKVTSVAATGQVLPFPTRWAATS